MIRHLCILLLGVGLLVSFAGCDCNTSPPTEQSQEKTSDRSPSEPTGDATEPGDSSDASVPEPDSSDSPDSPTNTVAEVCRMLAEGVCEPAVRCCQAKFVLPFKDKAECMAQQMKNCTETVLKKESAALQAGHLVIRKERVEACQQELQKAGQNCRLLSAIVRNQTCAAIFQDKASSGSPCKGELGGKHCDGGNAVCFPTPLGTDCKSWGKKGQPCSQAPCAPDLFCVAQKNGAPSICTNDVPQGGSCTATIHCKTGLSCVSSVCQPQKQEGASCTGVGHCLAGLACHPRTGLCVRQLELDKTCDFTLHCKAGLFCSGLSAGTSKICFPPGDKGSSCFQKSDCKAGLGCVQGACDAPPAKGQSCDKQSGCQTGFECDEGICKTLPSEGEPCLLKAEKSCRDGWACFTEGGKQLCRKQLQEGGRCTDMKQCQQGLGCDAGKCTKPGGDGTTCLNNFLCADGFYCNFQESKCRLRRKQGESCALDLDCSSGLGCKAGSDGKKTCEPLPTQGQPCQIFCSTGLTCGVSLRSGRCAPEVCRGATPR